MLRTNRFERGFDLTKREMDAYFLERRLLVFFLLLVLLRREEYLFLRRGADLSCCSTPAAAARLEVYESCSDGAVVICG